MDSTLSADCDGDCREARSSTLLRVRSKYFRNRHGLRALDAVGPTGDRHLRLRWQRRGGDVQRGYYMESAVWVRMVH